MPRRREVPKREILPDPVYNSQLVTKFINSLMSQGRKSVAERVFYSALKKVEDRAKDDPITSSRRRSTTSSRRSK